jgi:thiamine-phosphate pyrophosphorylase
VSPARDGTSPHAHTRGRKRNLGRINLPIHRLLYYITDRKAFAPDEPTRQKRLLEKISETARAGVDYIQLREKDLPTRALESLSRETVLLLQDLQVQHPQLRTKLLINTRTDVALASRADGVHLRSEDISPIDLRKIWEGTAPPERQVPIIGVSCHSPTEVMKAEADRATFAVFAPVFGKKDAPASKPVGLHQLRETCKAKIPVLALGGITVENAQSCLEAGAAGIAAIRLFQENDVAKIVDEVRRFVR